MQYIKIGKAAELLGVSVQTLHAWEASGELVPDRKSKGGTRYYDRERLTGLNQVETPTTCCDVVSSDTQKSDLVLQVERIGELVSKLRDSIIFADK